MKGKVWLVVTVVAILVLSVSLAVGCGEKKPTAKPELSTINPVSGPTGTKVVLIGANLGDTQGDSVVHVGNKIADVSAWSNTQLTAAVPGGLTQDVQGVTVLTPAGQSNELSFAVTGSGPAPDRKEGQVEYPTPSSAMLKWMKDQGIDTTGWTFSVVKVSNADPSWKIDQATKSGSATKYFLLHKVNNSWKVIDEGSDMTADQLQGDGAPGDLWQQVPTPPAQTQQQVIDNYLQAQGVNLSEASITFIMQSKIDPTWELFQVSFPPEAQTATNYVVLHQEGGNWVVKNYASDVDQTPGMPADLQS
jgi:IPT/TIG domain